MAEIKPIANYGNLCGEGPVWDLAHQRLYWTDCTGLRFFAFDWATGDHSCLHEGLEINSFVLNSRGGFVMGNNSGIWLWDGSGSPELLAESVEGAKCAINDSVADCRGRLLAGSWFYDPKGNYPLGHLIRVDLDGRCTLLDEGFHLANGLAFSPDNRALYFADSALRVIYAYDYDPEDGSIANRRVLVRVPATEGLPDGLAVDGEGFIWAAQWYGGCVVRYDPDGKQERRVEIPAKQVSNLAFGGPGMTDIFVTTAARSEPMPLMPPGYDPETEDFGGPLFHINLGIAGKPDHCARISRPGNASPAVEFA